MYNVHDEISLHRKIHRISCNSITMHSQNLLGVEGGFNPDEKQFEFQESISIVILPKWKVIPYPSPELPDIAKISAEAIMGAEDPLKAAEAAAMANTWEGEERKVSK